MGYSTNFTGKLTFANEITGKQLQKISQYLGEDCREHPEWDAPHLTYIDLKLTSDFSGLEWDGSEKTYDLVEKVNLLVNEMRKHYPDFSLEGSLLAQGEDFEDRWVLNIENGIAIQRSIAIEGAVTECPHCGKKFVSTSPK